MDVETNYLRGEVAMWQFNKEFMQKLEDFVGENSIEGASNCPYLKFIRLQKELVGVVQDLLGDDGIEPFKITINVNGKKPIYPPGPKNY